MGKEFWNQVSVVHEEFEICISLKKYFQSKTIFQEVSRKWINCINKIFLFFSLFPKLYTWFLFQTANTNSRESSTIISKDEIVSRGLILDKLSRALKWLKNQALFTRPYQLCFWSYVSKLFTSEALRSKDCESMFSKMMNKSRCGKTRNRLSSPMFLSV